MDIQGLLALVSQQNQDLVAAINALSSAPADPLQGQLDEANAKLAALQQELEKVSGDEKVLAADLQPQA